MGTTSIRRHGLQPSPWPSVRLAHIFWVSGSAFTFYFLVCLLPYLYHPLITALQAFDLLEMLNKEEEMLSAIKERQLQVLLNLSWLAFFLGSVCIYVVLVSVLYVFNPRFQLEITFTATLFFSNSELSGLYSAILGQNSSILVSYIFA